MYGVELTDPAGRPLWVLTPHSGGIYHFCLRDSRGRRHWRATKCTQRGRMVPDAKFYRGTHVRGDVRYYVICDKDSGRPLCWTRGKQCAQELRAEMKSNKPTVKLCVKRAVAVRSGCMARCENGELHALFAEIEFDSGRELGHIEPPANID
jgi:hypothetical protein